MPGQELTDQRLAAACEVIVLGQFGITLMGRTARGRDWLVNPIPF